MRFHPRGLLIVAGFAVLLMIGMDVRLGLAAILSVAVIDALTFLLPVGLGRSRG